MFVPFGGVREKNFVSSNSNQLNIFSIERTPRISIDFLLKNLYFTRNEIDIRWKLNYASGRIIQLIISSIDLDSEWMKERKKRWFSSITVNWKLWKENEDEYSLVSIENQNLVTRSEKNEAIQINSIELTSLKKKISLIWNE